MAKERSIKNIMALIPTPLLENEEIDETGLRNLVDYEMENGCHGVGVLAAIGEGYLLSEDKRNKVISIARDQLKDRGPLMAGVAAMSTADAIYQARTAEKLGATSVLAFNPQGIRPYSSAELDNHFTKLAESVSLEVVPYARKPDPIPFEVMDHLVKKGLVSSMKYAWLDCELLKKMSGAFKDDLLIFCGADEFTLRYVLLGCQGILTATAAMLPKDHVKLLNLVREGKIDEARALNKNRIMPWNDIGFYANWQAVHKLAFKLMGLIKTDKVVAPQLPAMPHQIEEVKWFVKNHLQ